MLELNPEKNDTSAALDLVRFVAAQFVCVGHAWNLLIGPTTYLPYIGVALFFVLSGFVIGFTLDTRSDRPDYGLGHYAIERFARIYSAYLPALVAIALIDAVALRAGAAVNPGADTLSLFLHNLLMLQGHPTLLGSTTFGTAGQLTSLAAEWHIYFFVGGIWFLCLGRQRLAALLVAIAFARMPLGYFLDIPGSDRNLFVLWLLGFASYFAAKASRIDLRLCRACATACPLLAALWLAQRTPGLEYALAGYPVFALAFLTLAVAT